MIHHTAVIHSTVRIGAGTIIGPYAVIDAGVTLGEDCVIGPHVFITGSSQLGARNKIHAGAVIGDLPQDLKFKGEQTQVVIGNENTVREHVTIHRSNNPDEPTWIGSNNLLMAHCHIGHNTTLGNNIVIANGALLAGHVHVADRVFISGNCLIHQHVRIGTLALMQGGAGIGKDLPPFTIARGVNGLCGLNTIGLRRAGFTNEERLELRRLYHILFRGTGLLQKKLADARDQFTSDKARVLLEFMAFGKRGFCTDSPRHPNAPSDEE
jgi:UDP-N-acetylglucosamine acyltransferase